MRRKHLIASVAITAFAMMAAPVFAETPAVAPVVQGSGPFIVIDQFGYLPDQAKIAVLRDPVMGFDQGLAYTPGSTLQVFSLQAQKVVFEAKPAVWRAGAIDATSGDKAWHFDFSAVTTPGTYVIRDPERHISTQPFDIVPDVYRPVLVQAFRTFFYQRAGFAKQMPYAEAAWVDGASHVGAGQDTEARLYSAKGDKSTARDLRGGWYDAGDYNKYTSWTADYVVGLLHAYVDNPGVFGDDFNIPESGNGVSDMLDEVKWGLDWLIRMQNADGSVLSVVGLSSGSPPSSAKGASYYGPATTAASLGTAAAFAYASKIYGADSRFSAYAADLKARAVRAWAWAKANPNVTFYNNDPRDKSEGLAAGQQEVDDGGRQAKMIGAAIYLYGATGDGVYRDYVDKAVEALNAVALSQGHFWTSPFQYPAYTTLIDYARMKTATPKVAAMILQAIAKGSEGEQGWQAIQSRSDPYLAPLGYYGWGSTSIKANQGSIFADEALYGYGTHTSAQTMAAAGGYLHYLHGVNPLAKVYLSNMGRYGAENSVDQFYHSWFADGSALWDSVRASKFGPAPGFLVGGPNASYNWDRQCPAQTGCGKAPPSPPFGQPPQKSYADFNQSWPLNSWEVTENSNSYQTAYLRLLARFVPPKPSKAAP